MRPVQQNNYKGMHDNKDDTVKQVNVPCIH